MKNMSKEGLRIISSGEIRRGLTSDNARLSTESSNRVYDVLVVGAGFAGLTAARDLSKAGFSVAVLEARDRIGGRTYLAYDDGQKYEMGGTWVHWSQPFLWREAENYGLDVVETLGAMPDSFSVLTPSGLRIGTAEEFGPIADKAISDFCNVDGFNGTAAIPRPYNVTAKTVEAYDNRSLGDRLRELDFDELSGTFVSSFISMNAGNDPDKGALSEQMRWWALGNYSTFSLLDRLGRYKFADGTAALANALLDDSKADLFLECVVTAITENAQGVEVTTAADDAFQATTVVAALPLNVLGKVSFTPPLRGGRASAASEGHVCRAIKFIAHIDRDLGAWLGFASYPNAITMALTDRIVDGRSVVIGFGPEGLLDVSDLRAVETELGKLIPGVRVERLYTHDWNEDPYAQGGWLWARPGQTTKCLADLQDASPPIFFAGADWARGWRGFIDGAIEDGARNARAAISYLNQTKMTQPEASRISAKTLLAGRS